MDISAYQHLNIHMSTRGKRPPRNLTPTDKIRAIQRIQNGETKAAVSRDIGVPESTLRGWCKNEQKLRFMCSQTSERTSIKKLPNSTMEISQPAEKKCRYNDQFTVASKFLPGNITGCTISPSNFIMNESPRKVYMTEGKQFLSELLPHSLSKTESSKLISPNYGQSFFMQNYLNHLPLLNPDLMSVLNVNFWNSTIQPQAANNKLNFIEKNLYPLEKEFYTSLDADIKGKQVYPLPQKEVSSCLVFDGDNGQNWHVPNISNLNMEAEPGSDVKKSTDKFYHSCETSLQWCKIFNTNLNILTSATIATIQSAIYFQDINRGACKKNVLIGENDGFRQATENTFRNILDNRYLDGEPEDLSMRSAITKISTPTIFEQEIAAKSITLLPFTQNEADLFS